MGKYYRDTEQLYEIYGYFMDRILRDDKIGPKMARSGIIIKFIYTDPDGEVTIDLRNPPSKPGYYGSFYLGPCPVKEDVWSRQPADHSHSFWHGFENPIPSITKGIVKQGGNIVAMMKMLPVVRPAFAMFPVILEEMGYSNLIIRK
jgi:hypothetical protein